VDVECPVISEHNELILFFLVAQYAAALVFRLNDENKQHFRQDQMNWHEVRACVLCTEVLLHFYFLLCLQTVKKSRNNLTWDQFIIISIKALHGPGLKYKKGKRAGLEQCTAQAGPGLFTLFD